MDSQVSRAATLMALCLAAATGVPGGELEKTDRRVVTGTSGEVSFAFRGAPRCDAKGNILVTPLVRASMDADVIWAISGDGRDVTHLEPRTVPGFRAARLGAITLGSDGQPYALVALPRKGNRGEQHIMAFDRKGKSKSKAVRLEGPWATGLAVFDSGRYLVSGQAEGEASTLFVMGTDGRLLTSVMAPGDPATRPAEAEDAAEAWSETGWSHVAELTFAEPTDDDHVVVVRQTVSGPAYKISSSGEVVQTVPLAPPVGATSLSAVKVSRGRLAALYRVISDEGAGSEWVITVTDLTTGVRLHEYSAALGIFACYETDGASDTFAFLRAEPEGLVIVLARQR